MVLIPTNIKVFNMQNLNLVYKGSSKDIYQEGESYLFSFADRYSVFDWGEMPDLINGKGQSLERFNKSVFNFLEKSGVKTHRLKPMNQNELMRVRPFHVTTQREKLKSEEGVFIPLEVIFRHGVPEGSSLLKRSQGFVANQRFEEPMIEYTTKLEKLDRNLQESEALELSGLSQEEWADLRLKAASIASHLKTFFSRHDLILWDGKMEFALGERRQGRREIILVDSIGPDELRLSFDGFSLSKEMIRQFYLKTPWFEGLSRAKQEHGDQFKQFSPSPSPLPPDFLLAVEKMYQSLADLIDEAKDEKPCLDDLIQMFRKYL